MANRGRAILGRANVPTTVRHLLWREAFKTTTLLDGLQVITVDGKEATRYVHWNKTNPAFSKHLRTWGEAGTVKLKTKMTLKLNDRGATCMMVGYALEHPGDTYRMWDPKTKGVHVTRDIIWLRRMYYDPPAKPGLEIIAQPEIHEISTDEAGEGAINVNDNDNETENEEENGQDKESKMHDFDTTELEKTSHEEQELPWTEVPRRSGRDIRTPH